MRNVVRYPLVLGAITMVSGLALGIAYWATKDRISAQMKRREAQAVAGAFGLRFQEAWVQNPPWEKKVLEDEQGQFAFYKLEQNGKLVGYAAEGVRQGYSSKIRVVTAVDPGCRSILGIRILYQAETPGLGARSEEIETTVTLWKLITGNIPQEHAEEEPWFQKQFRGKTFEKLVVVKNVSPSQTDKISAITGATITSNAVTLAVRQACERITRVVKGEK